MWNAETRASYVEIMGPGWVEAVEASADDAAWIPATTPSIERLETHECRVRWDWMHGLCDVMGAVYPRDVQGDWVAVPYTGGVAVSETVFATLEAAMAHVEANGAI